MAGRPIGAPGHNSVARSISNGVDRTQSSHRDHFCNIDGTLGRVGQRDLGIVIACCNSAIDACLRKIRRARDLLARFVGNSNNIVKYLIFGQIGELRQLRQRMCVMRRHTLQSLDGGNQLINPLRQRYVLFGLV
jgi:hypothetical protein